MLGFVVLCGDGSARMLPLSACDLHDGAVSVSSAFVLMEDGFYRSRTRAFTALRGGSVR